MSVDRIVPLWLPVAVYAFRQNEKDCIVLACQSYEGMHVFFGEDPFPALARKMEKLGYAESVFRIIPEGSETEPVGLLAKIGDDGLVSLCMWSFEAEKSDG